MDWTPGGSNSDVEDRRDSSGGGGGGFGFGGGGGGGLGIIGFIVLLVISLVTGRNFLGGMFGGSSQGSQQADQTQSGPAVAGQDSGAPRQAHPAGEDRDLDMIGAVLGDAQTTWTRIFAEQQRPYRHAKLVAYRGSTYSGCGTAQASTGPFYCPEDEKIYIDLSFWDELKRFGGSTAEFAQAYVVAHELGHHIQKLTGIEAKEQRLAQQNPGARNQLSVDLELQADCFAGVWAHSPTNIGIHPEDVTAALSAAAAVGDDHLQSMSGRAVTRESFTHGSSAQREEWFRKGLDTGNMAACDTFGANAGATGN